MWGGRSQGATKRTTMSMLSYHRHRRLPSVAGTMENAGQEMRDHNWTRTSFIDVYKFKLWKHWASAYLRQDTSYQCRDTDPGPYPDSLSGSPPKFNHFVHRTIANLPWKFRENPFWSFRAKLLTNKQTNSKQTNNDENITSLAEIMTR